ncbi:MAG TPA: peptidylprolyl isomerase, partial [Bacteroidota bacterium]|nr:peptidylprolyl isomerase [Bacteroidota bacterium]
FDGVRVHRVVPGFVIQTGDDKSKDVALKAQWGTGGQSIWGTPFADELNPMTQSYKDGYKAGVVAMANAGPNTNTSQFFICLQDVKLPNNYTIFGKVTKGMDVVSAIGKVPTNPQSQQPLSDVLVKSVRMEK